MRHAPGSVPNQIVAKHLLLRGRLDVDRLRDALVTLVRRHPILRTNYAFLGEEVLAIVHDDEGPDVFTVAARSGLSDKDEIREHVAAAFDDLSQRFLSPDRHSILQTVLIPHGDDLHSLIVAIDHVAVDERSRVVVQRELSLLYAGRHDELDDVHPYDAAAVRSAFPAIADSPALSELLTPLPPRYLPNPDFGNDPHAFRARTATSVLEPSVYGRVGEVARQFRCTRYTVHLAAVMWALKCYSDCDDVSLVTPMDTRVNAKDFDTVGYYQNQVFLRSRSPRSDGFPATVRECRKIVHESFSRRDYPVMSMVAVAAAARRGKMYRNPLFQVMLVYSTENSDQGWALDELQVTAMEFERSEAVNELRMHLTEHSGRTEMVFVGAEGTFGPTGLDRLLSLWQEAIELLTVQPTATR